MNSDSAKLWQDDMPSNFVSTLTTITDEQVMRSFLRDVMTEKEIIELSARLEAARMLNDGEKYTDIISRTKLSSRTVARISQWLKNGDGGYKAAIAAMNAHHSHLPPARAE